MKDRIRELAEQAGFNISNDPIDGQDFKDEIEKFSELIIQECCNVARRTILSGSGVNPNTFAGTVTAVQEIKKHFGVEE